MPVTAPAINDDNCRHLKGYGGNSKLKAFGQKIDFTKEQIEEYIKCRNNPEYFIDNYVKIINLDDGLTNFDMFPFQRSLLDLMTKNRFVIGKVSRQVGKTTVVVGYLAHQMIFRQTMNIGVFANKGDTARGILDKWQKIYENLPMWMQQGVVEWNKGSAVLENGSKIMATATGSSAGRSGAYNIILLDEFAFVPKTVAEEFFTSVYPTISSGKTSQVIMISTPNGMNLFNRFWEDAVNKRNGYATFEGDWRVRPGRDEEWRKQELAVLGEDKFRQEHECEFLGSTNTLIPAGKLKELMARYKPPKSKRGTFYVYEEPQPEHVYVATVDVSEGVGKDYYAISVFDVTQIPYKQVAVYRTNSGSALMFPGHIYEIAKAYNEAHVLVESNNNGSEVLNILHNELEYDNIFCTTALGRGGQHITGGFKKGTKLGVKTSQAVKTIGCSHLKTLIENDKLVIYDFDTISELTTFVQHGKTYKAEEDSNDDLAMTLVLFGWLSNQALFKEITNLDLRRHLYQQKMAHVEEMANPLPIIDDGQTTETFVDADGNFWWEEDKGFGWAKDAFHALQDFNSPFVHNDDDET